MKIKDVETAFAWSTAMIVLDNVHVEPNDSAAQFAYILALVNCL